MAFFEDVWSRNFLNIFATPLTISEYVGGLVLSSIATSAIGLVVMVVAGDRGLRPVLLRLRARARPVPAGAVPVRDRARHLRQRAGAAVRAGVGVVRLADPGAALAVRRRLLPAVDAARTGCRHVSQPAAAVVRVRGHARDRRGRRGIGGRAAWGACLAVALHPACVAGSSRASTGTRCAPACSRATARKASPRATRSIGRILRDRNFPPPAGFKFLKTNKIATRGGRPTMAAGRKPVLPVTVFTDYI